QRRNEVRAQLLKYSQQAGQKSTQQSVKDLEEQIARWSEEEKALRQRLEVPVADADPLARRSLVDLGLLLKELERKLDVARRFSQECELVRREVQAAPRIQLVLEATWPEP